MNIRDILNKLDQIQVNEVTDNDPIIDSEIDPKTKKVYGITKTGQKIEINRDSADQTTATYDPLNGGLIKPTAKPGVLPKPQKPVNPVDAQKLNKEIQTALKTQKTQPKKVPTSNNLSKPPGM